MSPAASAPAAVSAGKDDLAFLRASLELHHLQRLGDFDDSTLVAFRKGLAQDLGTLRFAVNQEDPAFLPAHTVKPGQQLIVVRMARK
jgi:hypothetical protein